MINGRTGEPFDTYMFYGPQTSFRLPKFVRNDIHASGMFGPKNPVNGQPLTGKRNKGGAKSGEQEGWVLLAQGAMAILHEDFFKHSDYLPIHICRNCNQLAIYNEELGRYRCKQCAGQSDICQIDSSRTALYTIQLLHMTNIEFKMVPTPRGYEQR